METNHNATAREQILAAASDLVSRNGFEAFTINALATKLHCSAATVYRHAGGKAAIFEALISKFSERIARSVNEAILVGLEQMRAEPLGQLIMGDIRPGRDGGAVSSSPLVAKIAEEMIGQTDPLAAQWLFRITFSLWYWPLKDTQTEQELVQRFAAPSVTQGLQRRPRTPIHP